MTDEIVAVWVDDHTAYFRDRGEPQSMAGRNSFKCAERFTRGGLHCDIDYVRIFKNDGNIIELCLHNIQGIEFRAQESGNDG